MWKIAVVILLCLALCGCSMGQLTPSFPRLVTQISVSEIRDGVPENHSYTDFEKMETLLNYLRLLDPYPPVDLSPETFLADSYEITLHLSDGSSSVYRQLHNQYLQRNDGQWYRIDASMGSQLPDLLLFLDASNDSQPPLAFPASLAYNIPAMKSAGGTSHEVLETF